MLKTFATLLRGAAAAADEDLADRNALLILEQQTRDAAAGIEASKRALAIAMAQEAAGARRLAETEAGLADLEDRAVAALRGGREDLAAGAAAAILAAGADRDAACGIHATLRTEVEALRQAHADAARRLAALQRGRTVAQAAEAVRRLRAGRLRSNPAAMNSLAEAEATLARLRARQAGDAAAEAALETIDAAADATVSAAAAKLGAEGFGPCITPGINDVMTRLRAKAAAPAAAQAS